MIGIDPCRITKNRYSLVLFGGRAPHDVARVRTFRGNHFVTPKQLRQILQDLPDVLADPAGSADVIGAVRLAAALNFRAGVSKTFILLPCSSCGPSTSLQVSIRIFFFFFSCCLAPRGVNGVLLQQGGYRSLSQMLVEQDVTLHVIADQQFQFSKVRASRQFLG